MAAIPESGSPRSLPAVAAIDTMTFLGNYRDYTIRNEGGSFVATDRSGTRIAIAPNIKRLLFQNGAIGLDVNGVTGQAYRLYRAAFNRIPDIAGLGYWIHQIDNDLSFYDVAWSFINSDEFKILYGMNVSNDDFITALYTNVLHREPDPSGFSYWRDALLGGRITRHAMLAEFSNSAENQAQIANDIQNGIVYLPIGVSDTPDPSVFAASLVAAPPAPGFQFAGTALNFVVNGSQLGNVELVSANNPSIIYGRFTISPDKTSATLTFNPLNPPYGEYNLRILAWNTPPGQGGEMIEVMSPRVYSIRWSPGCVATNPVCGSPAP
jgi:hypothetical protein